MPLVSQDFLAKLPVRPIDWIAIYTDLRASTVLQRAGAVLWTAGAVGLFVIPHKNHQAAVSECEFHISSQPHE